MEDLTGKELGAYRIVAPQGEGGMAAVYKAYQPAMDRYVAIKVLPQQLAHDPQFVGRFKQEGQLLARLQHPHILPVFDYGESGGYTYLVMPFVDSGTLTEVLKGRQLPLPEIRSLITQIGDALDYAHSRGLVHRDVKPSNVLVDARGNCLLTDFGLAKMVEGAAQFTSSGGILGTPAYMSPEQGRGVKVDARTDIYALGVILYEMATGRVPFDAETPIAIVFKHISDPLPLPTSLNPRLPGAVERVILKALAKDPDHRFANAGDMVRALQAAIPLGPTTAAPAALAVATVPPPAGTQPLTIAPLPAPARSSGRRTWALALGGLGALVVCGLLAALLGGGALMQFITARGPTGTPAPTGAPAPTPTATSSLAVLSASPTAPATGGPAASGTIKVVSILPMTGPLADTSQALINGMQMAFEARNYVACDGRWSIGYDLVDDSSSAAGTWDPAVIQTEAARVMADPGTVAILGPLTSREARLLIPLVNPAHLLVLAPAATYAGLTKPGLGGTAAEPERYYPSGVRNFARPVPADDVQGAVAARAAAAFGLKAVFIVEDGSDYGHSLAEGFAAAAGLIGLPVVGRDQINPQAIGFTDFLTKHSDIGADLVFYAGQLQDHTPQFFLDLHGLGYKGYLAGGDALMDPALLNTAAIPVEGLALITNDIPVGDYQGEAADWREQYQAKYGRNPLPTTIYGYIAAQMLIDAFERLCAAGGSPADREAVRRAVLTTSGFHSPMGDFSIDANGDSTLTMMGAWQVQQGQFKFVGQVDADHPLIGEAAPAAGSGAISNAPAWTGGASNFNISNNVGQSFLAAGTTISSVEVDLLLAQKGAGGDTLDLRILSAAGQPLAEVVQQVPGDFEGWLTFKISSGLRLTPGETYIISLQDTNASVFFWKYAGDTYPNGTRIFTDLAQTDTDYFFKINP